MLAGLVTQPALAFHLNEVIQNPFFGHVTVEREVGSEMVQERVQVQRVVAVPPAVDALTPLQNTQLIQCQQLLSIGTVSFCYSYGEEDFGVSSSSVSVCVRAPPCVGLAILHRRGVWRLLMMGWQCFMAGTVQTVALDNLFFTVLW